jgi:hypothetical protein
MAGSLVVVSYESDNELDWNVKMDETNAKLEGFGFTLGANATASEEGRTISPSRKLPISMRYALVAGSDADNRLVRRKLYVHDPLADVWVNPTTIDLEDKIPDYSRAGSGGFLSNVRVTALIGEKRFFAGPNDSGIIDGTTGDN